MSSNRAQLSVALAILALSVLECVQTYPQLPDPMASNFGGDGTPGGWSSKRGFIVVYGVSMGFWLMALLATPLLAKRARQDFDEATRRWLRGTVGWFIVASLAFSAIVTHLVVDANLTSGRLSAAFVWLLGVYMAYVIWWTVRLVRRARAPSTRAK